MTHLTERAGAQHMRYHYGYFDDLDMDILTFPQQLDRASPYAIVLVCGQVESISASELIAEISLSRL